MSEDFISVFWAWNGDLNRNTIEKQLKDFRAKGITDVFAHARAGLKVEYMGKEWMDAFAYALSVAEKVGIKIWIYDENGWPSGFAGGKVYAENDEYKERYLVKKTAAYSDIIKSGVVEKDIYAVYDTTAELPVKVSVEYVKADGGVFDFIIVETNQYYVDITNPDAIACFIKNTHERYKERFSSYFGNVIPGIFTDEPHVAPQGLPYGKYIVGEYEKKYGDFSVAVENLFYEKMGYEQYRYNYRKTVIALIKQNYAKQYGDWCKKNSLIFTGHFASEEGLASLVSAEGSVMPYYTEMGLIGVDALGNRLIPTVVYKQSESIARQFGNGKVLCETYAGTGYDCTFKELLRIWAFQAIHGVTHLCASISMMSLEGNRKRDYPQFFSEQMPWWEKAGEFFSEVKNINRLSEGERLTDTLVVFPISGTFCLYGLYADDKVVAQSTAFRCLTENLTATQVEFDYGDENMIAENAIIKDGKFVLGKVAYDRVIIPESPNIESGVLNKIREFASVGGEVLVVGELPYLKDGAPFSGGFDFPYTLIANRRDYIRKYVQAKKIYDTLIYEPEERRISADFETTKRIIDGGERIIALNKSRNAVAVGRIITKGKKSAFYNDGEKKKPLCGFYDSVRDESEFFITLKGMEYAFYDITDGAPQKAAEEETAIETVSPVKVRSTFNTFTVDKAALSVNGGAFDEQEYAIFKTAKLYREINGKGDSIVKIKYVFNARDDISVLFASLESGGGRAFINGEEIFPIGKGFYSDTDKYDLSGKVRRGENEFLLLLNISAYYNEFIGKEVFQSVMNVFSFPFYVEFLFLEGDFSVNCDIIGESATYISCKPGFSLAQRKPLTVGDLSLNGMPFFSGKIIAEYIIKQRDGFYVSSLSVGETFGVFSALTVGGKEYNIKADGKIDIDGCDKIGDITVKLTLYSSLRNLFGPHHHVYGKHYYTGPSVFEGYAEWQDSVVYPELKGSTYIDDYSFTRFVLPKINVRYVRKG